ncbi:hypothetical protein G7Y79_00046g082550 [Physcia stellaris]|nr:hypothetical protein G7Y79_00046g082550 [Physcia stellaris]
MFIRDNKELWAWAIVELKKPFASLRAFFKTIAPAIVAAWFTLSTIPERRQRDSQDGTEDDKEELRCRKIVHYLGLFKLATGYLPLSIKIGVVLKKGYDAKLAFEEWIIVLGKIVGSVAAGLQGVEPISCVAGFTLINAVYLVKIMRITGLNDSIMACSVDDGL